MTNTNLEERIAHLIRTVDELSDVVAQQDRDIALLKRRVATLVERETERESLEGSVTIGNERPPHY
jgi:SlyX protein